MICNILSFIILIFIIFLSTIYRELWKPPGNFLMMVSISELLLSAHWFSIALYYMTYDDPLKSLDLYC